ncbi:TPA: hypothetical protein ACH3X2_008818 [Trebouxia sp. C0005]
MTQPEEGYMLPDHLSIPQEASNRNARASLEGATSRSTASILNATRGLDQLLHTAHQQRIRQLRKIQQMRRHSEANAALHRSWQLKQQQEEEHQKHVQEERVQAVRAKQQHEQLIEKRRLEVAAAADERAQRVRAAHQAKLARAEQLAAVVQQKKVEQTAQLKERSKLVAMRNEEVHHKSEQILEQKKHALQAKEALEQEHLRNIEADKQAREAQRNQAKARRIAEAQRAQQRAALDLQQKINYFQRKNAAEEAKLLKKQEESEAVRQAHREEARLREEETQRRLEAKARRDEATRAQLSRKTANKMARADLIEAQRQALLQEMQHIRKDILQQESWLRAGFEKMEVTGRFELPEELLNLERSGMLESATFDHARARRSVSTAPSPPLGPQDPLRTTSAQGGYILYDESSRKSVQGESAAKRPLTAHASIPSQGKGNSYAQQANNRRGKASASVGLESERSVPEGAANSYQDSIKAQYQSGEAAGAENGIEAFDEQQHQHQQEQLRMLLQDEQVKEVERESILSQAADEREHQRLMTVINSDRDRAQKDIEVMTA